jgi:hypothetical protein
VDPGTGMEKLWIRDGKKSDPGWKKVGPGIRNKHPGSATLVIGIHYFKIHILRFTI